MSIGTYTALLEAALTPFVLLLVLAPGLGPAVSFARRAGADRGWVAALAFGFSVAWCAITAMTAHYLGFDLAYVVVAYAAAGIGSLAWAARSARTHGPLPSGGGPGLALAAGAGGVAWLEGPWWFGTPDTFYHLAAARSLLATGRPLVTDPFFGTAEHAIDPTSGILHTLLAVLSRLTGSDVAVLFRGLTAVSAAAVVLAFWLLARRLSGSSRTAAAVACAWIAGAWFVDFRDFGYPNKVSIALALITIALVVWTAAERGRDLWLGAAVVGFAAFAMHIAAAELVLLCTVAVAVALLVAAWVSRGRARLALLGGAGRVSLALALTVAAAVPTLLPRLAALEDSPVMGSDSFIWAAGQVHIASGWWRYVVPGGFDFGGTWAFATAVVIGLLAVARLRRPEAAGSASAAAIALLAPVITVVPPVSTIALATSSYMVARMAELLRFAPYAAAAWALGAGERLDQRWIRVVAWTLLAATVLSGMPYLSSAWVQGAGRPRRGHLFSVAASRARDLRPTFGLVDLARLREVVGDRYPVVMADPETGYYLMGLEPVAVVAALKSHTPVFIGENGYLKRLDHTKEFFTPGTTSERRAALAEEYGARYAIVWSGQRDAAAVGAELRADPRYEVLVDAKGFTFFGVR